MPGRRIPSEREMVDAGYGDPEMARRREVLRETIAAFTRADPADHYYALAHQNLERWRAEAAPLAHDLVLEVLPGDWGDVTLAMTRRYGARFAVLNMANAYVPGGGYVEGMVAQEENMFRRTDCHLALQEAEIDRVDEPELYVPELTALLEARDARVYLDVDQPRVCIRASEDRSRPDLGYRWLADDEVFSFYELRAAAQDLRAGDFFDPAEMRRRISAQLDTLIAHGVRHAILGAFGCGAFGNPAHGVAPLYREEIERRSASFSVIVFAIFHAGYGPGNYEPFVQTMQPDSPRG